MPFSCKWTSGAPFPLEYFFTVCGVLVAGDSYWSSKRKYAAATDLKILQPKGNKR
jgi:hypothetical protein